MNVQKRIKYDHFKYILFIILWLLVLICMIVEAIFTSVSKHFIYWGILMLYIYTVYFTLHIFKLRSKLMLLFSFGLFFLAGLLTTFKFNNIAETIMRISLVGWFIGLTQAFFEYLIRRSQKNFVSKKMNE